MRRTLQSLHTLQLHCSASSRNVSQGERATVKGGGSPSPIPIQLEVGSPPIPIEVSPLIQLGCLEERRKLPRRARGGAPAENAFSAFSCSKTHLLPVIYDLPADTTPAQYWGMCQAIRRVELSVGRPPGPTRKRPPGRPRAKWTDQLHRDNNNIPIATLWRQAIGRCGHSRATLRSEPTTR